MNRRLAPSPRMGVPTQQEVEESLAPLGPGVAVLETWIFRTWSLGRV